MSDDGQHRRGRKELFWAIPRGTVCFEPAPVVKLKPAEYAKRVQGEKDDALLAELNAKPLAPCTREDPLHCEASMNQEDLNALMRNPWEAAKKPRPQPLPECPQCGERYCGDGIAFCTECANTVTPNAKVSEGENER